MRKSASTLKKLVGNDLLTPEGKSLNSAINIRGNFGAVITCNSRLRVRLEGDAGAWRRRLMVIEYNRHKPEKRIADFAQSIADHAIELLPGVAETLPLLATRHRLILVTKGNAREQQKKLDRSGIHMHFTAVEIPPEKHLDAYHDIVSRYSLTRETTWMIGNSPRSDINPALAAGLHAVYMHHPNTWVLEHDNLAQPIPPQQLIQLDRFNALAEHF